MYTISLVLAKLNRTWSNVDFSTITINTLLNNYDLVLITLNNGIINTQYSLNAFTTINGLNNNVTLISFFNNYNGVLPTPITPSKSLTNANYVVYNSLWFFGLIANRTLYNSSSPPNIYNQPDLIITPNVRFQNTLSSILNKVLLLVNGLVVFPTYNSTNQSIYLLGASSILDRYSNQQLSIIDFSAIGGFTNVILTTSNTSIHSSTTTGAIVYITLSSPITGFTPLFIRNGKLKILDNSYSVISPTVIAIKINYRSILDDLIDMNASDVNWINSSNLHHEGFLIDSVNVLNYLTTGTSSIVLLNTSELCINITNLFPTGLVNEYVLANPPTGILYLQDGTIGDYVSNEITDYGTAITTTGPKLLKPVKNLTPNTGSFVYNGIQTPANYNVPYASTYTLGVNNTSLSKQSDTSYATIIDLYIL